MRILLDLSQVVSVTRLPKGMFDRIAQKSVQASIYALYDEIHRQATMNLKGTRSIYKRNINRPMVGRTSGSITLTGALANMVEQGAQPFDMKVGFANSSKKRPTKSGGWVMSIPLRLATPGSLGENEAFAGVIPKEIMAIVKTKGKGMSAPFKGMVKQPGSVSMSELKATKFGVVGMKEEPKPAEQGAVSTPSAPSFVGLSGSKKLYQGATGGKFGMFRTVSNKSAPNSWIHRGIKEYNLFGKATKEVDFAGIVGIIADEELSKAGL